MSCRCLEKKHNVGFGVEARALAAAAATAVNVNSLRVISEDNLERELDATRFRNGLRHRTEGGTRRRRVREVKNGVVQRVISFRAELRLDAFPDRVVAQQREVDKSLAIASDATET